MYVYILVALCLCVSAGMWASSLSLCSQ